MGRPKENIWGYRSQMRELCRFREMAMSGRIFEKYSKRELLRSRLGDTVYCRVTQEFFQI